MYQITAVFNKANLSDVLQELYESKIEGVTLSEVIGKGGLGFMEASGATDLYEKVMAVIVVSDDKHKETAMEAIRANCQDLGNGAGKMWVTPVLEVERIRTGEKNESALTQSAPPRSKLKLKNSDFTAIDTPSS
jgi:nitrogen regulatory protein PII